MAELRKRLAGAALCGLAWIGGCAVDVAEDNDPELNAERQQLVNAVNGLPAINGLTSINGLASVNGLPAVNGLPTVNGLASVNGLPTVNGLPSMNGLPTVNGLVPVDCTGKTPGKDCSGSPDGILSATRGMMASDEGIVTATYLVRCALPQGDAVTVKDYTGGVVRLSGEIGLTPSWKTGSCDSNCQEKISACLMSLTNTAGNHVNIELTAPFTIGAGHSSDYKFQEAMFYGNLFLDPPQANYATGKDYEGLNLLGLVDVGVITIRLCSILWTLLGPNSCPYVPVGNARFNVTDPLGLTSNKCSFTGNLFNPGIGSQCKDKNGKTWKNVITTYRKTRGAT